MLCATGLEAAPKAPPAPLFCDMEQYAPPGLTWSRNTSLEHVSGVYPHPVLPFQAVVATAAGLEITEDAGFTWKPLPEATVEKTGVIRTVVFDPAAAGTFYLASKTKGIWSTTDSGKTFTQIGTTANGLAADDVADLDIFSGDKSRQTLLAVHGESGAGMSYSHDGGKTWEVMNPEYHFRRVLSRTNSREIFFLGSSKQEPDIQSLYVCGTPGEYAVEILRDMAFTDIAASLNRIKSMYVTTTDGGLYRVDGGKFSPDVKPLGSKDESWASVSTGWGPNADVLSLSLYSPSSLGLVITTDDLKGRIISRGGLVSSLVQEGSVIRPNSNGTVYYGAINGSLSMGRSRETVPVVSITPAVFRSSEDEDREFGELSAGFGQFGKATGNAAKAAKELCEQFGDLTAPYHDAQILITARVPVKPAPPTSVTVDLSRYGGTSATPLYDDGLHGDGAAGDGVYGLVRCFQPIKYHINPDTREWRNVTGRVAFGVTATYADGRREGAVAVAGIYPLIQSYDMKWGNMRAGEGTEGDVKAEIIPATEGPKGGRFLSIQAGHGPWSVILQIPYGRGDFSSYEGLSFSVKAKDGNPPAELYLQLRDAPELSEPVTTERVPVIREGMKEGAIGADFRRVVVPLSKLLGKDPSRLETGKVNKIIISGDGESPVTLIIDGVRVLASEGELTPPATAPPK